jgi:diguanylate cyclase (GGDEF)-like protein
MTPELEKYIRNFVNFPTPPGVAAHIIELAQDPDIEMGKVAKAVSMDPALTTKVLRIANSPLYAQRRKSENLRQALVVLGLNATLTLALSFTLVRSLRGTKPNGIDYPFYWRRVLIAATAARALGEARRLPLAEELFLAGLLQDVGMVALDQAMPDLYRDTAKLQRDHRALLEFERKRIKADHAEVGGALMAGWNLPERLHRAISNSHTIHQDRTEDQAEIFDRCVALSGLVADLFVLSSEQRAFAETAQSIERSLGMDKHEFGLVLGTIGGLIPDTESIFETDLRGAVNPDLILEQAREILMIRNLQALREVNTLKAAANTLASRTQELEEELQRDPLTGAYSRAFLDAYLVREFDNATRNLWPLSIAFADLDNFKRINDTFGHQAGDQILQATARILKSNTRDTDVVARYGGEEFVIAFPATDADTARSICERIVWAFQQARHDIGLSQATVTISIGCATHSAVTPFQAVNEFIRAADQALYTAKLQGRNRSVKFEPQLIVPLARSV